MIKEITKKEIEELEETSLRLHTYLKRLWEEYDGFKRIYKSLRKKIKINFSNEEVIELDMFKEYCYYQGKLMAYIYVLESHNCFEVPQIIQRLRGIKLNKDKTRAVETKYVLPIDKVGKVEPNPKKQ